MMHYPKASRKGLPRTTSATAGCASGTCSKTGRTRRSRWWREKFLEDLEHNLKYGHWACQALVVLKICDVGRLQHWRAEEQTSAEESHPHCPRGHLPEMLPAPQ
eukprot:2901679-Pyramimonas_sp.AAC.1